MADYFGYEYPRGGGGTTCPDNTLAFIDKAIIPAEILALNDLRQQCHLKYQQRVQDEAAQVVTSQKSQALLNDMKEILKKAGQTDESLNQKPYSPKKYIVDDCDTLVLTTPTQKVDPDCRISLKTDNGIVVEAGFDYHSGKEVIMSETIPEADIAK